MLFHRIWNIINRNGTSKSTNLFSSAVFWIFKPTLKGKRKEIKLGKGFFFFSLWFKLKAEHFENWLRHWISFPPSQQQPIWTWFKADCFQAVTSTHVFINGQAPSVISLLLPLLIKLWNVIFQLTLNICAMKWNLICLFQHPSNFSFWMPFIFYLGQRNFKERNPAPWSFFLSRSSGFLIHWLTVDCHHQLPKSTSW